MMAPIRPRGALDFAPIYSVTSASNCGKSATVRRISRVQRSKYATQSAEYLCARKGQRSCTPSFCVRSIATCSAHAASTARRIVRRRSAFGCRRVANAAATEKIMAITSVPSMECVTVRCHARYADRSEEHTSELQSHLNLVCRLLLEKKKKKQNASDIRAVIGR